MGYEETKEREAKAAELKKYIGDFYVAHDEGNTEERDAALKKVLSDDVAQKGSNITEERLRFDFNFPRPMTPEEISAVEDMVNDVIKQNIPVVMKEMTVEEAKEQNFVGLFTSKYGDVVKTYSIGDFSREICGGPHAAATGELGRFKIIKEQSSSAGIRRIKAVLIKD